MSDFEERARAAAEARFPANGMRTAFVLGARWADEQDPTDAEVEVAAEVIYRFNTGRTTWEVLSADARSAYLIGARAALLAARDARRDQ